MDENFWFRVDVQGEDDCWEFMNQPSQRYGVYNVKIDGFYTTVRSHRYAWEQVNGPIPDGLYICHLCDYGRCCNPAHLWLGTNSDNQLDSVAKGRSGSRYPPSKIGEEHHSNKLTEEQVQDIRLSYAFKLASQDQLAEQYGVTQTMISKIVLRKSWKHI